MASNAMERNGIQTQIGVALVDFAQDGTFPEEEAVVSANIEDSALPGALRALNEAKTALEVYLYALQFKEFHADTISKDRDSFDKPGDNSRS